jgi:hypothetical protein
VKEIAMLGGDVSSFVPPEVVQRLEKRFGPARKLNQAPDRGRGQAIR